MEEEEYQRSMMKWEPQVMVSIGSNLLPNYQPNNKVVELAALLVLILVYYVLSLITRECKGKCQVI